MMYYQPPQTPDLTWTSREVVRELNRKPHLLVAVEIRGPYFPHRALVPFARIVPPEGRPVESWFAEISDDSRTLKAFFTLDVPQGGHIEFGYGDTVMGRLGKTFDRRSVPGLDRQKLPDGVVVTNAKHAVERQQKQQ
jgi:hypothetical protein